MLPTELFEKRRQNLSHAIDRWVATGQFKNGKAVCEHHDLDIPLITQLLNSHRQIGEKFARELEQQLGLVKGSLDGEVKFVESIELMMAAMPLFRMQVHESEAFTLISIENDQCTFSGFISVESAVICDRGNGFILCPHFAT